MPLNLLRLCFSILDSTRVSRISTNSGIVNSVLLFNPILEPLKISRLKIATSVPRFLLFRTEHLSVALSRNRKPRFRVHARSISSRKRQSDLTQTSSILKARSQVASSLSQIQIVCANTDLGYCYRVPPVRSPRATNNGPRTLPFRQSPLRYPETGEE